METQRKDFLVNHVISFGVHWPNFEKKWPLGMNTKLLVAACGNDTIHDMDVDVVPALLKEETDASCRIESSSHNLVDLLFENNCITYEKRKQLKQLDDTERKQYLLKLLETGSIEMYEIVIDYFEQTGQTKIAHLLQLNREVQKYGKYIVNCVERSSEILNSMIKKNKLLNHFTIEEDHPVHSGILNKFETNEHVLNILECSKQDVYIFFLNFLMATKQHALLLPMLESLPYARFIEEFESYLLKAINADSQFLLKLVNFNVINEVQMLTIESSRNLNARNKHLLDLISKSSTKSFILFLTALVQTGQLNILENMHLIHSDPDEPSGINKSDNLVETEAETEQENQSVEISSFKNKESGF